MTPSRLLLAASSIALAAIAVSATAQAASFSWDTTASVPSSGGVLGPFTNGGQSIYAEGFQITGNSNKESLALQTAQAVVYTGAGYGIGVTDSGENGSSPGHTVSNEASSSGNQITDLVVFKLPGDGYIPTSIMLNQFCANGNASGASSCAGIGSSGWDDLSIYIGGTNAGLSSLSSFVGLSLATLQSTKGFTRVDTTNNPGVALTGSGNRTVSLGGGLTGDYLIVAASLNDATTHPDYFKIAAIGANSPTVKKVPEPGSLALFGVGLAGLAAARRRVRKAA